MSTTAANMQEQETSPCRVLQTLDGDASLLWSPAGLPGECGLLRMCSFSSSFYLLVVPLHLLDSDIEAVFT